MKKITKLLWSISLTALMGCSSNANNGKNAQSGDTTLPAHHHHEEEGAVLTLNNGSKWKADSNTNTNVKQLVRIAEDAKPVTLTDYQKFGDNLQEGIHRLIKDCRMKGAEHEALHRWMEVLLEKNKKLMEISSVEEAQNIFREQKQHLNLYQNYFE